MHEQLKDLRDVFLKSAFAIPAYQRGYAWADRHRADLLADLRDLERLGGEHMHYTGTLVVHSGRPAVKSQFGDSFEVLDIVDGQQRLTTLVILLSVFARALASIELSEAKERARRLTEAYLVNGGVQKLTPSGDASAFFRDHIVREGVNPVPDTAPARALLDARRQFERFVAHELHERPTDEAKLEWLGCWADLVTQRLGFIVFKVRTEADVGVMFEAMNARGKPLTQTELVKNYLLYASAKVAKDEVLTGITREVSETWSKVVRVLDRADLSDEDDTLLRYHWAIWPKARGLDGEPVYKTSEVHRALKATVPVAGGADQVLETIREYLTDHGAAAPLFADLRRSIPGSSFAFLPAEAARSAAERAQSILRLGRSAATTPLLMAAMLQFGGTHGKLLEIMRLSETLIFRLCVNEARSHTGQSSLMGLALEMRSKPLSAEHVISRLRTLIDYYTPDKAIDAALRAKDGSTDLGNFYGWPQLPNLLFEYERSLVETAKQKFALDWTAFYTRWRESIEHILPQGEATLTVPYWKARFSPEEFVRCRHRLGNLTLTEWNSHYGNHGFDQKRGDANTPRDAFVYRNSRLLSERELCDIAEWTPAEIDNRQERIANFAMQRWSA